MGTEVMYLLMVMIALVLFTTLWDLSQSWFMNEAEERVSMVGVYVAVMVVQGALVFALFRDSRKSASQHHRVGSSESQQAVQKFRFSVKSASSRDEPPLAVPTIPDGFLNFPSGHEVHHQIVGRCRL